MKNLTGKNVQLWIKKKYSLEEVAELIGETVEDTKQLIERKFSKNAESFIRALQNNKRTRLKTKKVMQPPMENSLIEGNEVMETVLSKDNINETSLRELKDRVDEQQKTTIDKELVAKKLREQYRSNLDRVTLLYNSIEEMREKVSNMKAQIDECDSKAIQLAEMHEKAIEELHEEKRKLSKLRAEYEERSLVQILVYGDGSIICEQDGVSYPLNFDGWEKYRERLMEPDCYETICNLKLKEISQLAKLLKVVAEIQIDYTVTFDSSEMEAVFKTFTGDATVE